MSARVVALAIVVAIGGTVISCGGNPTGPAAQCGIANHCSGVTLSKLTLTPPYDTLLAGDAAQIVFAATDASGNSISNVKVKYSSSNIRVATVDTSGLVRAIAPGSATVTIAAGGLTASSLLTVLAPTVVGLTAGSDDSCMLLPLGRGYCWGLDTDGQLGSGVSSTCFGNGGAPLSCAIAPVPISGGLRMTTISAGGIATCGLATTGAAYCWGDNSFGELGINSIAGTSTPVPVTGELRFTSISVGGGHVCAIATAQRTFCWGNNASGQLGDAQSINSTTPIQLAGGPFVAVTAGGVHTCGLTSAGIAYCWGDNTAGQLGAGFAGGTSATPVPVAGGQTFAAISAGALHTCGVVKGGSVYCWGDNTSGELGLAAGPGSSATPVLVTGVSAISQVSAGDGFTCALSGTGVVCWGSNAFGQLGAGAVGGVSAAPQSVTGGMPFGSVTAGARHVCAVVSGGANAGRAACWGSDIFGALGNSRQATLSASPVLVGSPLD